MQSRVSTGSATPPLAILVPAQAAATAQPKLQTVTHPTAVRAPSAHSDRLTAVRPYTAHMNSPPAARPVGKPLFRPTQWTTRKLSKPKSHLAPHFSAAQAWQDQQTRLFCQSGPWVSRQTSTTFSSRGHRVLMPDISPCEARVAGFVGIAESLSTDEVESGVSPSTIRHV